MAGASPSRRVQSGGDGAGPAPALSESGSFGKPAAPRAPPRTRGASSFTSCRRNRPLRPGLRPGAALEAGRRFLRASPVRVFGMARHHGHEGGGGGAGEGGGGKPPPGVGSRAREAVEQLGRRGQVEEASQLAQDLLGDHEEAACWWCPS